MTRIILVRHGESLANLEGKIAGHSDVSLTALGVEQALQTADFLADVPITAIYSSDLSRAMATAQPHAQKRGLSVIPERALREIFCGRWEGRSFKELESTEYDLYVKGFREHFLTCVTPEGETAAACGKRFYDAVLRIAKKHEGETVLIASHGGTIRLFWAIINRADMENANDLIPFPSNSSYSVADFDGERFIPIEFSKDSHLTTVTHVHI